MSYQPSPATEAQNAYEAIEQLENKDCDSVFRSTQPYSPRSIAVAAASDSMGGTNGTGGAQSLTDLTDVTGEPGLGKSPVYDDSGIAPLTHVVTQDDLDALIREVYIRLTPATPGVIGQPGLTLETLTAGDILVTDEFYVGQPWDGNNPTLYVETDQHADLNSNGISSANDWLGDGHITTADILLGTHNGKMFNWPDTIRVWVADDQGNDPGSTIGSVIILLRIVPATALVNA